jgi:hypothetical protein
MRVRSLPRPLANPAAAARLTLGCLIAVAALGVAQQAAANPMGAADPSRSAPTNSEQQLIDPPAPGAAPKTYALISAVGTTLNMVSSKYQTGSNIDPFGRKQIEVGSQALNNVVLLGLEKAVERIDPDSKRLLLHVSLPDLEGVGHNAKPRAISEDMFRKLQVFEDRQKWDTIITVTPRYQHSGVNRMGDKLWGIGFFIHDLDSARLSDNDLPSDFESFAPMEEDVSTTKSGVRARSNKFVAPYAYLRFTVYDAKTLQVIRVLDRLDARKTIDPDCNALRLSDCFNSEQMVKLMVSQTERSVTAGVTGGKTGTVELKDPKLVAPAATKTTP